MPVSQSNEDMEQMSPRPAKPARRDILFRYLFATVIFLIVVLLVVLSHPDPSAYKPENMPDKGKNLLEMLFK